MNNHAPAPEIPGRVLENVNNLNMKFLKNKFYMFSWLAAAAMTCGMASCQSEDAVVSSNEEEIVLEAEAIARISDGTRTAFPATESGYVFQWSEGDRIVIMSEDGSRNLGVLTLSEGAGEGTGKFSGTVKTRSTDTKANIFYLGRKQTENLASMLYDTTFDMSKQLTAHEDMTDFGIMHATADLERIGNKVSFTFNVASLLGYARFNFHLPEGVTASDEAITVKGKNIFNAFTLSLADATLSNKTEGEMTIVPDWKTGDAFMAFVPAVGAETMFEVTIGDKTYKAELDAREYKANIVFCGGKPLHGKDIYFSENGEWKIIYMNGGKVFYIDTDSKKFVPSFTKTITDDVPEAEANMEFLGWSDTEGGAVKYVAGDEVTLTRPVTEMTVYAVWKKTSSEAGVTAPGSTGTGY